MLKLGECRSGRRTAPPARIADRRTLLGLKVVYSLRMRKQYHFRRTNRDVLIWDVDRLVTLSRKLPVAEVPLSDIAELDETFWFRLEGESPTCRRVAEHARLMLETDLSHPILLGEDGRVMDGMHRVCRAMIEGRETIPAVRFEKDPEPDFVNVPPDELPYDHA
jgi:hypothetical protein